MSQNSSLDLVPSKHLFFLLKCWFLVFYVRLLLSFRSYKPVIEAIKNAEGSDENYRHPLIFVWGVKTVARYVPKASCLTQALSLRWLMTRAGKDCSVQIGVAPGDMAQMKAHAWVTYRDTIILGGDEKDFSNFTPITTL